jgi:hypothetical protein
MKSRPGETLAARPHAHPRGTGRVAVAALGALLLAGCSSAVAETAPEASSAAASSVAASPSTTPATGNGSHSNASPSDHSTASPGRFSTPSRGSVGTPSPLKLGTTNQATFWPTGTTQTWTVPDGVTSVSFEAAGGEGGEAPIAIEDLGGSGAIIIGSFPVTPGQVLSIAVGSSGGTGAGGWGALGMSGGPANTAKNKDRSGASGGGATLIALANADGSDWHEMVVAGGGGGMAGGSSDPAGEGQGGNAGCSKIGYFNGGSACTVPSITGTNGGKGSPASTLGGKGGAAGSSSLGSTGERGLGAKDLGGNGGAGGGGVNGGAAGGGGSGISAGGGGGAGTSYVDVTVPTWQISSTDWNISFTQHLDGPGVILTW